MVPKSYNCSLWFLSSNVRNIAKSTNFARPFSYWATFLPELESRSLPVSVWTWTQNCGVRTARENSRVQPNCSHAFFPHQQGELWCMSPQISSVQLEDYTYTGVIVPEPAKLSLQMCYVVTAVQSDSGALEALALLSKICRERQGLDLRCEFRHRTCICL